VVTLTVLLALLVVAPPDHPPTSKPVEEPAVEDPDLDAPLAKAGPDADFDPAPDRTSLQFGPVRPTRPMLTADLGWMKSGVRFLAGAGVGLDLIGRFDTFLPGVSNGGQSGVYVGVRWSSQELDPLRLAGTLEAGEVFVAGSTADASYLSIRSELAVGLELAGWRPYGRALLAVNSASVQAGPSWFSTSELGLGVERTFDRNVVGLDGFTFIQSGVPAILMWRARVGRAF
jgi:hypothetical protein